MVTEDVLQKINHGFKMVNLKMEKDMGIKEKLSKMDKFFMVSFKMANLLKIGNDFFVCLMIWWI